MLFSLFLLFVLFSEKFAKALEHDYDIQLERTEAIISDSENLVDISNLKIIRRKRDYFFDGYFIFHEDMYNNYTTTVDSAYSPLGNSQFMRHPFRVPQTKVCEYFKTAFRTYLQPMLNGKTNFPTIPETGLCPIPKGNYYIKNLEFEKKFFPSHVPRGLWRIEQKFFKGNQLIGGLRALGRIINK